MRLASFALAVAVVSWSGLATAQQPRLPNAAQQTELDKLQRELDQLQLSNATVNAAKVARKLYDLERKIRGDRAVETERRLETLASLLQQVGDYGQSAQLLERKLAVVEAAKGAEAPETLIALNQLTGPYVAQGRFEDLEPLHRRILALTKKLEGEQSRAYVSALSLYGVTLQMRSEYSSALRTWEDIVRIEAAMATDKNALELATSMQVLANLYFQSNQQKKAIALYDRIVTMATNAKDASVQHVAGTLWGVAAQYHYGGRPDLAIPLRQRVIALFTKEIARLEKTAPDDHMLPSLIGQLGFQYREHGDLANADKYLSRAVALDEKRGGFSGWAGPLADIKRASGKLTEALAVLEHAQAHLTKMSPTSSHTYSSLIGDVLRELKDYKRAEATITTYLASVEKTYGVRHPLYGLAQLSLARVYMAAGRTGDAERVLGTSLEAAERDLSLVLKTGTEADHAVYFTRNAYLLDFAINFQQMYAPRSPTAVRLAMTMLLRRKGRVLDAAAANLKTIRAKLSPDDKKLLDELAGARGRLAKLTVAGPAATGKDHYAKEIAALEDQIQRLELAVGKKSAAYRAVTQTVELSSVQRLIPKDARLVEIVNHGAYDPNAPYTLTIGPVPRRYIAYVAAATGDPQAIDLGPAEAIDTAVEKFRKAVSDPANKQVFELGNELHALVFAKLAPALGTSTRILIAPDGALNVVPFAALVADKSHERATRSTAEGGAKVDDKQELLIKKYTFTYLTSGRDLLRLTLKSSAQGGGVMFADPSFDATGPAAPASGSGSRGRRSSDLASLMWPPLPGTGKEADEIEKKMRGLRTYRGKDATETTVKQVRGPRVLHLATHGFFLPDEKPTGAEAPANTNAHENPLLRSGLAFAGANKLSSGDDDGILTAMEATGLDLWGTKLVVLSACDTGVGKVTNGDGVYGLRRALVIAGAESLVMSLWQVDDFATKELMAGYYGKLGAGKPRSSALREVQLELAAQAKYAHPFYWAAFLPAGDDSPLGK